VKLETYERWILRRALEVYAENQRAEARELARDPRTSAFLPPRSISSPKEQAKAAFDRANDAEQLLERLLRETA
jgi:hypothetical protein